MTREDRGRQDPDREPSEETETLPERRSDDAPAETDQGGETRAESGNRSRGGDRRGDERPSPGPNELYCYSCGTVIKREAEICPDCGVRQRAPPGGGGAPTGGQQAPPGGQGPAPAGNPPPRGGHAELTTQRQRELEKKANNDLPSTLALALFSPLFAYVEVGKPGYAVLNLLTANYLMLGILIVPLHTYSTISDARERLRAEGVEGY